MEGGFTGTNNLRYLSESTRNLIFTFALIISILLMGVVGYRNATLNFNNSEKKVNQQENEPYSKKEAYLLELIRKGVLSNRVAMFWGEVTEGNE